MSRREPEVPSMAAMDAAYREQEFEERAADAERSAKENRNRKRKERRKRARAAVAQLEEDGEQRSET